MERFNVSSSWRMNHTDTTFTLIFAYEADTRKALDAIKSAIKEINYENGYAALWIQDLSDNRTENGFEIEGTLMPDEFEQYVPAMLKAVAKALPSVAFTGSAKYESMRCFQIDEFEFSYAEDQLYIKETYMDETHGYFCPDCGYLVAFADEEIDPEEIIECEDCNETFKGSDLEYVAPEVNEEIIIIR